MAPTWQEEEQKVRDYLEWMFDQPFSKKRLEVSIPGHDSRLTEFDAVSADNSIVAQVKAYRTAQPQEIKTALIDVLLLECLDAPIKLVFFTDPLFYQVIWRTKGQELLDSCQKGIRVVSPWELIAFQEYQK